MATKKVIEEKWKRWNQTKSQIALKELFEAVDPIIQKEVNRWQGVLARPVLELRAKELALDAFNTYRPSYGAALTTHLTNYLKKLSRLIYSHQNIARIPEQRVLKIKTFEDVKQSLERELGRPPSVDELADRLGWSQRAVTQMERDLRREAIESSDIPSSIFGSPSSNSYIDLVYYDLNPQQKLVFEYITGYGGKPVLSNKEIMKKLNITQGQLSYIKKQLIDKFKQMERMA